MSLCKYLVMECVPFELFTRELLEPSMKTHSINSHGCNKEVEELEDGEQHPLNGVLVKLPLSFTPMQQGSEVEEQAR
jgi:hypothetical protein